jgi:hypothetical protein
LSPLRLSTLYIPHIYCSAVRGQTSGSRFECHNCRITDNSPYGAQRENSTSARAAVTRLGNTLFKVLWNLPVQRFTTTRQSSQHLDAPGSDFMHCTTRCFACWRDVFPIVHLPDFMKDFACLLITQSPVRKSSSADSRLQIFASSRTDKRS